MTAEQKREYLKQYRAKNKEHITEYKKQWRLNNKETISEYNKEYHENNKEKSKEYYKTPAGKKSSTINNWKQNGLICPDYDLLYSNYLAETHCDDCRCRFGKYGDGSGTHKCMDHDHQTGLFRNFICCKCNVKRG